MKYPAIAIATLILGRVSVAAASTPVVGQNVLYRYNSTHDGYDAIVTAIEGDGSVDLVVFDRDGDVATWPFGPGSQGAFATVYIGGVVEGSSDNRWRVNPDYAVVGPTGATGPAGPGALVTGSSTPTLTLNGSAVQFDTVHDTEYTANVKIVTTLTLTGGTAGHIDLVCDSSPTPTTIVETVSGESTGTLTVGLATQTSVTMALRWRVPAGHRCKLVSVSDTGTATFSIVRQSLQTLGS